MDLYLEIVQAIIGPPYHGLEPIFGLLESVFGIIILLDVDALGGLVIKCKTAL